MSLRTLVPVVACASTAVMAGFYGTFSTLVMPALRRADPVAGMTAMQLINKAAPAPWLAVGLLVAGGSTAGAAALALANRTAIVPTVGGAVAYWLTIGLTIGYHVPRNNRLDGLAPGDEYWASYLAQWVPGNHLRALACALATGLFAAAIVSPAIVSPAIVSPRAN